MKIVKDNALTIAAASFIALSLTGCETLELISVTATASCSTENGECEAGVEAQWEPVESEIERMSVLASAAVVPDAAQFTIDTSGSTIPYPYSGLVNITLTDTTTGIVQASQNFNWIRNAGIITLQNPDAVNNWAMQHAGTANKAKYSLLPFESDFGGNLQRIAVEAKYENETLASYSSTFLGSCASDVPRQVDCIGP